MAFTVVRYSSAKYGPRSGVATTWLHALAANGAAGAGASAPRLPIFLRRGGTFGPPEDAATPLIMVGPGTGVAPFRGFLQHRRAQLAGGAGTTAGTAWLYFGCRREDHDYLYRADLEVLWRVPPAARQHPAGRCVCTLRVALLDSVPACTAC